ncbi:HTH-type transcriptional repressor YvoA [Streptomyces sp. ADI92-24]|uniref:GntR family transcriptional regulator n=1 Tax=unclassified Streptomyces TaxID=2593676 RepID=UPI000F47B083|nr:MULTISPECIES: GntR family transcriptional regulator [unclassified Streptomyces]MCX4768298.1 GntR family transcriptional regulator [Streptomyces sp. NBC_01285]ROQ77573.1 GntR family transcriptional regulator [Streptomyces sp. CEV 2-1]RPK39163.1 HTH-type transcriptional repressor YvoA [Streptomyces sp. ADI92-24]
MESITRLITIDRSSPVPLYFQVAQQLQQLIESGTLAPGTRLENEIALADQFGLSRPTMRQAMQHLVDKGLLARKRGVGTQVVNNRVRRQIELTSLFEDLKRDGRRPRTALLSMQTVPASAEVAAALKLEPGTDTLALRRLRYADDEPIAVMENHLPTGLLGLTEEELTVHGLYELLRRAGVSLRTADQTIGARRATAAESRLLNESRGGTLLTMERTVLGDAGRPVEFGSHLYRASRYSFEMTLTAR